MHTHPRIYRIAQTLWICALLLAPGLIAPEGRDAQAARQPLPGSPGPRGPFVHPPVMPFNLEATATDDSTADITLSTSPLKYVPGTEPKGASQTIANWVDEVAQTEQGQGLMPAPIASFDGMSNSVNAPAYVLPPDTNGDVSADLYIQTVNTAIAIYIKDGTLTEPPKSFNNFFPSGNVYCDSYNRGDPVVVYDRFAQRWVISDFAFASDYGPFYECVAVSKSATPTLQASDWWMYAIKISDGSLNDYPKLGVWRDGYYLSFNMFKLEAGGWQWDGVQLWALEKSSMLSGGALQPISFYLAAESTYASLLPAHALDEPPSEAPAYFASLFPPDRLQVWEFQADWTTPGNSTLSGPSEVSVADFAIAASVPQKDTPYLLDSLSYRPMMQLVYRAANGIETLWMNHTVASGGVAGVRWYELRDPGGAPLLFQHGTYQPDERHRWMGSLAVDQDGNMAVGYSLSSPDMYPAIYYAGRLAGETPGLLTQAEQALILGSGSQTYYIPRWGDYSAMSVDPVDDCTFWYTTEYYSTTGSIWRTRIGSFKFPSCGQPMGYLRGSVRDASTDQPIPGAPVTAVSASQTFSALADEDGSFVLPLLQDRYTLTAGPLNPGYPNAHSVADLEVTTGLTTTQNMLLVPAPNLVEGAISVDDRLAGGNPNGYPEPGEMGLELWNLITNNGAAISTQISATLNSLTPGVAIESSESSYPDIPAGSSNTNLTPFVFSIDSSVACGSELLFQKVVTDSLQTYALDFSLNAGYPLARTPIFENDVESGAAGWSTGGANNTWAISSETWHSPEHAWSDSPGGNYANNTNSYLASPSYDLSGKQDAQLSLWVKYSLEPGYDMVYLDYSLDGGAIWSSNDQALAIFNGYRDWHQIGIDAAVLDNQPSVAFRFRLVSDSGVTDDGIAIDDIALSYQPYICTYDWQKHYFPWISIGP